MPALIRPVAPLALLAALAAGLACSAEAPADRVATGAGGAAANSVSYPMAADSAAAYTVAAPAAARPPMREEAARAEQQAAPPGASLTSGAASTLAQEFTAGIPAMLVRTGTATIEVDSLEPALDAIRGGVRRVGGFVSGTQFNGLAGQRREASIELRVPSSRFDEVVAGLAPLGKVQGLSVSTQDVGEEYTDIASRVTNARRLEARLIDLLATRTGKLSDVLTVERELARVREEIERMEGRMRFLQNRASLSTLSLTVQEELPVLASPGGSRIGRAFERAWDNFVDVVAGLIAMFGVVLPLGLVLVGVVVAVRKWGRRLPPATT